MGIGEKKALHLQMLERRMHVSAPIFSGIFKKIEESSMDCIYCAILIYCAALLLPVASPHRVRENPLLHLTPVEFHRWHRCMHCVGGSQRSSTNLNSFSASKKIETKAEQDDDR